MDSTKQRESWVVGSQCAVYSNIKNKWVLAQIKRIYEDEKGEWLVVEYVRQTLITKEIQRFSHEIRPIQEKDDDEEKKEENESDILFVIKVNKGTLCDVNGTDFYDEEMRIKRIRFILSIYSLWITNHENKKHFTNNHNLNMNDIICDCLDSRYDLMIFLADYRVVNDLRRDLLRQDDDADICNANLCKVMDRNENENENKDEWMDLYYIAMDNTENESSIKNMAIQQMLDDLHCFVFHSLHIDVNDDAILDDLKVNDKESDDLCHDFDTEKIINLIDAKKKRSNRYRERKTNGNNNKFMTTNTADNINTNVYNKTMKKEKQMSFVDALMNELIKNDINIMEIQFIHRFIFDEDYDSDTLIMDSGLKRSVFKVRKISNKCIETINKLIKEKQIKRTVYSKGKRIFYWPFYKDNKDIKNGVFKRPQTFYEENIGYQLCDWFIPQKYANLKDELLNNLICVFSVIQYETTMVKAKNKLNAWINDKQVENIRCKEDYWERIYGIKMGDEISLEHIMAILFYTNYTKNCTRFSATFRKCHEYESDESMKNRHKEVRIWAKLIRESVECFGIRMVDSSINAFYHGVSDTLIFDSTSVKLFGPVSTTADFHVATGIFGREGIVVEFGNSKHSLPYFNCRYWSDFTSEDEKLFCGGLQEFHFDTIRNMKLRPVRNYSIYIKALNMFHFMIEAWPWAGGIIKSKYGEALELLISEEISGKAIQALPSKVPQYILNLWHYFLSNIKHIEINWNHMNREMYGSKCGYKTFSSLFCNADCSSLDFCAFLNIFSNIECVQLYVFTMEPSIALDEWFLSNILSGLTFINNSSSLRSSFKSFDIFNPLDDITHFINQNNAIFNQNGWNLKKGTKKSVFHSSYSECSNCLCIQKL